MNQNKYIVIYGAGISGLVAAINLAKTGFEVEVRDKNSSIGGSKVWHPSIHHQTFDINKTSNFIGIDITQCFKPVEKHTFYFYGNESILINPDNSYVCEKGNNTNSIENYLYKTALEHKVRFSFNHEYKGHSDKSETIVATGLEQQPYIDLGIKHSLIQGYRSSKELHDKAYVLSYFGKYTNDDFAYVASNGNTLFSLLFSRKGVDRNSLDIFKKHLYNSSNIEFDEWAFSKGCIPLEKNLVKDGVVLAGTISGMIDPFFFNGISAALISGKIAADYFIDREMALNEFNNFSTNFYLKRRLKYISEILPLKKYSFPLMVLLNNRFKWVGVI